MNISRKSFLKSIAVAVAGWSVGRNAEATPESSGAVSPRAIFGQTKTENHERFDTIYELPTSHDAFAIVAVLDDLSITRTTYERWPHSIGQVFVGCDRRSIVIKTWLNAKQHLSQLDVPAMHDQMVSLHRDRIAQYVEMGFDAHYDSFKFPEREVKAILMPPQPT